VVVADVLEGIGDAADQVFLANAGHFLAFKKELRQ
jgi:hypothetical protein